MSSLPVQLAPHGRDDLRGDVAEGAGVSTREMLRVVDEAIHICRSFLNNDRLPRDLSAIGKMYARDLRAFCGVRALILSIAGQGSPPGLADEGGGASCGPSANSIRPAAAVPGDIALKPCLPEAGGDAAPSIVTDGGAADLRGAR